MSEIIPYDPVHVTMIDVQPKQMEALGFINMEHGKAMADNSDFAVTVIDGGEVMACGGLLKMWPGRSILWGLISTKAGRCMVRLVNVARGMAELNKGGGRLEVVVRSDFEEAHRFAKMAGFKWHHHEEKFLPGGFDADIYLRHC